MVLNQELANPGLAGRGVERGLTIRGHEERVGPKERTQGLGHEAEPRLKVLFSNLSLEHQDPAWGGWETEPGCAGGDPEAEPGDQRSLEGLGRAAEDIQG